MRNEFLPFSRPSITEDDIAAVGDVLRSGWITTGPHAAALEQRFCEYTGCGGAIALSSATAGMHLLLAALGIGPGDEVITSSLTWVSTVNLIVLAGATPVFADVDRDTLMVTPETLAPCFTERTRLVVPVHFAGAPVDLDPIVALAAEHGAPVVQDAAHAVGTRYRGRPIGCDGTAIFSFHPIKNITTGEGGMVVSDDPALLERIRRLKFHGLGVDAYDRKAKGRSPRAEVLEPGFKYNLPDLGAVLGVRQLDRLDAMNARRAELAAAYRERLADVPGIVPLGIPAHDHRHAWHLFVVRVDLDRPDFDRDAFMARLGERNIGTGLHFRAVHTHRYYRGRPELLRMPLPATEWNSVRVCSLPLFPDMSSRDLDEVILAIQEVLDA